MAARRCGGLVGSNYTAMKCSSCCVQKSAAPVIRLVCCLITAAPALCRLTGCCQVTPHLQHGRVFTLIGRIRCIFTLSVLVLISSGKLSEESLFSQKFSHFLFSWEFTALAIYYSLSWTVKQHFVFVLFLFGFLSYNLLRCALLWKRSSRSPRFLQTTAATFKSDN